MIRIGLLNIQNIDNYGANLIAYSMEQELQLIDNPDAEVETINFCPNMELSFLQAGSVSVAYKQFGHGSIKKSIRVNRKKHIQRIRGRIGKTAIARSVKKLLKRDRRQTTPAATAENELKKIRKRNFEEFHRKYLHLSKKYSSKEMNKLDYDIIVVGSDVVWKPTRLLTREEGRAYFLTKDTHCKKIAYAASIGISDKEILDRLKKRYARAINRFDFISLREGIAQRYVQELLPERDIQNCIDPVFLRSKEEYMKLISERGERNNNYIYVYLMGKNAEAFHYAEKLGKEKNLPLVIHSNTSKNLLSGASSISDGPIEFLERVCNASYIVTDTFHGTALSIIFEKQFITFTRGNMSVRLEDFLSRIGIRDRLVESTDDLQFIQQPIDFNRIRNVIDPWVDSSRLWLKKALTECEKEIVM